jgi:predicted nucleotidyltransferase
VLVTFSLDADWSLFDRVQMQQELASIVGRKVDLVSKRGSDRTQNWLRHREILETAKTN